MRTVVVRNGTRIPLGKQGENKAVRVVWPEIAEKYTKLYGDGRFELVVVQKGQAYPAVVSVNGADLVWDVLAADVATMGAGSLELIYYVGDTIAKSQTWETFVVASKSAEGTTDPPEPAKNWVDTVLKSSSDAKQAATESAESARQSAESSTNAQRSAEKAENAVGHTPIIGENGNWFVWDFVQSKYVDTGKAASTPPINTDTAGKHLVNDGEKSKWQDMSPLIVNITKDGQDESGDPIYKSDRTFDEIKAAYDTGREVKLEEIGDLNSMVLQEVCGSEPKLFGILDDEAIFFCIGTATAFFNNAANSIASYGGIPTFMIAIIIAKSSNGDVVDIEPNFRIDEETGQTIFEPDAITKLSSSAGAEVFYIDLTGNYPDYTCSVVVADIKAAYEAGKVLECRCMMGYFTATLPLFMSMQGDVWIFSGAITFKEIGFKSQTFTVAIGDGIVLANSTQLVDVNGKLPNPYSLTITSGGNRVTYDGHEQVSIDIPSKQEAQGYVTAHNEDTAAHQDIRTALTALKPKACLVTLGSSDWDATAKTQVVAVSSVVADEATQMIHTMPKIGQVTDYNNAGIQLVGRGAGNVTFMCDMIPEKDIEVWVVTEDVEDVTPLTYLTFSSPQPFTLKATKGKTWDGMLEYSYDTRTWTTWDGSTSLQPPEGYRLYMRGIGNTKITGSSTSSKWELTGTDIACTGNIENLLDYTVVKRGKHPVMAEYCYNEMFLGCRSLTTAPELPATTLAEGCYRGMFQACTGLTTAPELPATVLATDCYHGMFKECTGLTTAPELPATTLAANCYSYMLSYCRNLTAAPSLPATALAKNCYSYMFQGCTRLTTAPELPAATLAEGCYRGMFQDCTGLTTAPSLPATTLATKCYGSMFQGCTRLTTAPELPVTTLAVYCYGNMFNGCTSLTTAPELPATTLAEACYDGMFNGCTRLTAAPELPATTLARTCYRSMFYGCTSLTTTPELPATKLDEYCYSNMFNGCTGLTTAPELSATTLADGCYENMFLGCTSLTTAPELPATTLARTCYSGMFEGCTSLTTAPELSATTLAMSCYTCMFKGCTRLTTAPKLPATSLYWTCYSSMFYGCTRLTTIPELPATTLDGHCYGSMFEDCTRLKLSTTATDSYTIAYRIPSTGEGTSGYDSLTDMFAGTGGTFVGTPEINTTYYLDKSNSIA